MVSDAAALFDNATHHAFIYGPAVDAFNEYDRIIEDCCSYSTDWIIYIALGAAGSVLAFDLARLGYQALDLGNLTYSTFFESRDVINW